MAEKHEGVAPSQESKYEKPPEGACPSGLWMDSHNGQKLDKPEWVHDATCDCEEKTGRDAYTGKSKEE